MAIPLAIIDTPKLPSVFKFDFTAVFTEWLEYKKGQISEGTCRDYKSLGERFILNDLGNIQLFGHLILTGFYITLPTLPECTKSCAAC